MLMSYFRLLNCHAKQFGLLGQLCMYSMPHRCLQFRSSQLDRQSSLLPPTTFPLPAYTPIHCGPKVSHPAILSLPTGDSTQSHSAVIQPSLRHKSPAQYRSPASASTPSAQATSSLPRAAFYSTLWKRPPEFGSPPIYVDHVIVWYTGICHWLVTHSDRIVHSKSLYP